MNIPELVVQVGIVTEFLKKAVKAVFKVDISGAGAVILSVVVSLGVIFFAAVNAATPLTLALIPTLIQVVIYANGGFQLLKAFGGSKPASAI